MPLIATKGAASAQGFGEFAQTAAPVYIEDVFSTYLYTGTGSSNTITNNIDISGKGGLVWAKGRTNAEVHGLFDTARGANLWLSSNTTDAQTTYGGSFGVTAFNNNGFTLGTGTAVNAGTVNYVSWTFREQPKFFDIVTYTGNGSNRTIAHNLGSVPGCIIVKRTSAADSWRVYHRSLANNVYISLNNNDGQQTDATIWNSTTPTSTVFSVGTDATVNANGATYVAYLFAHDAGGFGLTGSDNVISCGSFTTDGSGNASVSLGYEPQWLMVKSATSVTNWNLYDSMRGFSLTGQALLNPNLSDAEGPLVNQFTPNATGFNATSFVASQTFIYIAIRRGPMKTPTSGTSVFTPVIYTADNTNGRLISSGFPVDSAIIDPRNGYATPGGPNWFSRLTGNGRFLRTASTDAEANGSSNSNGIMGQDGITVSTTGANVWSNVGTNTYVSWFLKRAPGFFDVVCYTGTGSATTISHNLGVAPELIIVKLRSTSGNDWIVYSADLGTGYRLLLDADNAKLSSTSVYWNSTAPTSSVFSIGTVTSLNNSGSTYVAYLFASVPGVSKVGSYTGTGTTLQINCGFTNGARFVMIKRTDSIGDWWIYDSARGIVAGNDPYLFLNTTAAEVTNTDYVDTYSAGFELSSTAPAGLNANGGTYIFLAIA